MFDEIKTGGSGSALALSLDKDNHVIINALAEYILYELQGAKVLGFLRE